MSITVQTRPDTLENTNLKEILTQDAYAYEEIQPNGNGMVETIDQYRLSGLTPQSIEQKNQTFLTFYPPRRGFPSFRAHYNEKRTITLSVVRVCKMVKTYESKSQWILRIPNR